MPADAALSILSEHGTCSTSTDIAVRHGVSATTVQRVARIASVSHPPLPKTLSIDAFKGNVGAKFQVILNDLEQRTRVDVLPDRSKERLLADLLRYPQEKRICFGFRNFEHFRRRIILLLNHAARMKRRTGRKLKKRSAASSD